MNLIALDVEATDSNEILELSIVRYQDQEVLYHSYFRPRAKRWPNSMAKHHITPAMVRNAPRIEQERKRIREIINACDGIIFFAPGNDVDWLASSGIGIPTSVKIIDAKDWFWYFHAKEEGIEYSSAPGLERCAEMLGFPFSPGNEAHSARNDTLMTIKVFDKMLSSSGLTGTVNDKIAEFEQLMEIERVRIKQENAAGYISLMRDRHGVYSLKNNSHKTHLEKTESTVAIIKVAARYTAEYELKEKFKKREIVADRPLYRLKDSDIEYFRNYTNEFVMQRETLCKQRFTSKPSKGKKKSKLSYKIG